MTDIDDGILYNYAPHYYADTWEFGRILGLRSTVQCGGEAALMKQGEPSTVEKGVHESREIEAQDTPIGLKERLTTIIPAHNNRSLCWLAELHHFWEFNDCLKNAFQIALYGALQLLSVPMYALIMVLQVAFMAAWFLIGSILL